MSVLVSALVLISAAMLAGAIGYALFNRYTSLRAIESGLRPWQARAGAIDGNGATTFERAIHWELLFGRYQSRDPKTLKVGRASRRWTLTSVALAVAAMALLLYALATSGATS
jgi:hypothetical protein